jgi:hypothetical protein
MSTHWTGCWVRPTIVLDDGDEEENPIENQTPVAESVAKTLMTE